MKNKIILGVKNVFFLKHDMNDLGPGTQDGV